MLNFLYLADFSFIVKFDLLLESAGLVAFFEINAEVEQEGESVSETALGEEQVTAIFDTGRRDLTVSMNLRSSLIVMI